MPPQTSLSPSPTPSADITRQLRVWKWLVLFLLLALAGGTGYFFYARHLGQPMTILVGGKPVATVRNAATANQVLAGAEQDLMGAAYAGQTPVRLQKVQFAAATSGLPTDADNVAQQKLASVLKLRVHATVIVVNGKPSVGLPTPDLAQQTLDLVKEHFAQMPPQAQVMAPPQITETVTLVPKVIDLARARPDAETAAPYFWTPPAAKTYTVRRGDTGFGIASRNHISFADFLTANPNHDLNKLKPGDVVNVQRMPLLLTVRVKKSFTQDQAIVAHVPADEAGQQRVTYMVTYLNGQETRRDVTNSAMLTKPLTRMDL